MTFGQPTAGDLEMMNLALGEARSGLAAGGVPVGAVLASGGGCSRPGVTSGSSTATRSPTPRSRACVTRAGGRLTTA